MILASQTIGAQPSVTSITITPPARTMSDLINATIDFRNPGQFCSQSASTVVNGNTIQTTIAMTDCELVAPAFNPPLSISPEFGPLPAGTYTYQVYFVVMSSPPELGAQQGFAVAIGPPIPTLQPSTLAALALILAGVALFLIRRH